MPRNPLHSVELVDNATMPSIGKLSGQMGSSMNDDSYELSFDGELQCVVAKLREGAVNPAELSRYRAQVGDDNAGMQTRLYPISYVRSMVPALKKEKAAA